MKVWSNLRLRWKEWKQTVALYHLSHRCSNFRWNSLRGITSIKVLLWQPGTFDWRSSEGADLLIKLNRLRNCGEMFKLKKIHCHTHHSLTWRSVRLLADHKRYALMSYKSSIVYGKIYCTGNQLQPLTQHNYRNVFNIRQMSTNWSHNTKHQHSVLRF